MNDFDSHFRRQRLKRQADKRATFGRLLQHLRSGGTVRESAFGHVCRWDLTRQAWEPSARTPARMARHLTERHHGFSTTMELV